MLGIKTRFNNFFVKISLLKVINFVMILGFIVAFFAWVLTGGGGIYRQEQKDIVAKPQSLENLLQSIRRSSQSVEYRPLTKQEVVAGEYMPIYSEGYLVAGRLSKDSSLKKSTIRIIGSRSDLRALVGNEVLIRGATQTSQAIKVRVVGFVDANQAPFIGFLATVSQDTWNALRADVNNFFEILLKKD